MRKRTHFFFILICLCLLGGKITDLAPKAYAASAMTASEPCVAFIKKFEGFSSKPYYDYGQHTVGYGTKCPTDKYFDYLANGIPVEEAEALLRETLTDIADTLQKKLIDPYNLTFTQHQFDALVSFSFNVGTGWMTYDSILRNAVLSNAEEDDLVYAFSLYSTAGGKYLTGLVNRRLCEANIFLNGVYSQTISDAYGYVSYEPNGGTLTYQVQGFVCDNHSVPVADAVRIGDVFLGWYTDLTEGTKITELTRELSGKTLFARWQSSENSENQDSQSTVVIVTGDIVNIRKGPGTNYAVAAQVRRDDSLLVSHVIQLSGRTWGKVDRGWICLEYTNYADILNGTVNPDSGSSQLPSVEDTVPEQNPVPGRPQDEIVLLPEYQNALSGTVYVNDFLRIRSGPGTAYSTIGYLSNGDIVDILEQRTVDSTVWGRIYRGWVSMDYILPNNPGADNAFKPDTKPEQEVPPQQETQPEQEATEPTDKTESTAAKGKIIADALRIRSGPGTEYSIVGFYYQNEVVVVSEKTLAGSVYWGKTDRGWIHMDYFQPVSSGEVSEPSNEGTVMTVIADCLRVRKEIGTSSRIAALLYYGDTVTVFETQTVEGTVWGRVDNGWICMDYVT